MAINIHLERLEEQDLQLSGELPADVLTSDWTARRISFTQLIH